MVAPGFLIQLRQLMAQFFASTAAACTRHAHRILAGGVSAAYRCLPYPLHPSPARAAQSRWSPECGACSVFTAETRTQIRISAKVRAAHSRQASPSRFRTLIPLRDASPARTRYTLSYTFIPRSRTWREVLNLSSSAPKSMCNPRLQVGTTDPSFSRTEFFNTIIS